MTRILITGVNGFVGRHLANQILAEDATADLHGTILEGAAFSPNVHGHPLDLREADAVRDLLIQLQPQQIYHLAGTAAVGSSFSHAWETLENNLRGQLNLLTACVEIGLRPRLLVVSSGAIYGDDCPADAALDEDAPLRPTSPYSVSKAAQDLLAQQYYLSHDLPTLRARPFNHFGPGQGLGFATSDFAHQIARIEAGLQAPTLQVGDLSAERDFTDVRDIARAYTLLMMHGQPGSAYNIASGRCWRIEALLQGLLQHTTMSIDVTIDPSRLRPQPQNRLRGDASRLRTLTGWTPTIPFETTLQDVLTDFRQRLRDTTTGTSAH